MEKPFTDFDLNHKLIKFRKDHFRQKELELIEIEADTDRLTGLANRRKMDGHENSTYKDLNQNLSQLLLNLRLEQQEISEAPSLPRNPEMYEKPRVDFFKNLKNENLKWTFFRKC